MKKIYDRILMAAALAIALHQILNDTPRKQFTEEPSKEKFDETKTKNQ